MDAPTQIDCFAIILYEQGDLKIKCNLKDYNIKPMSILFAPPGTILQMVQYKDSRTAVFYFHKQFIQQLNISVHRLLPYSLALGECYSFQPEKAALPPCLETDGNDGRQPLHKTVFEVLPRMREIHHTSCYIQPHVVAHATSLTARTTPCEQFVQTRRGYVPPLHSVGQSVPQARAFHLILCRADAPLTPKYLSSIIRRASGHGPAEWINQSVVLEAKNMLKHTNKSIQEVAFTLNFPNQSFFGRWFKTQTGLSPKEYRNQG